MRGLKLIINSCLTVSLLSHPAWVRGLKRIEYENSTTAYFVAPRVGAWIETDMMEQLREKSESHPAWVRGLKLDRLLTNTGKLSRTPRGCVD